MTDAGLNCVLARILELHSAPASANSVHVSTAVPAGRGLVFAHQVAPGQTLLKLSRDMLVNIKSFSEHFHPKILPAGKSQASGTVLSSSQALSLLLARTVVESRLQAIQADDAKTQTLKLFIKTMPNSFETMPLVWLHRALEDETVQPNHRAFWKKLTEGLPRHSRKLLQRVYARFQADWSRVQDMRSSEPDRLTNPFALSQAPAQARAVIAALDRSTFLWAWCCVNTRCVYLPLQLADHADNFTLVPILDMANHTSDTALECKVRYTPDGGLTLHAPARSSPMHSQGLGAGDECFITYGPHSNESLLSEYGFVLPRELALQARSAHWSGNRFAGVLVDEEVQSMLEKQGREGERKVVLLQNRGYWGDLSLHPYPGAAHPSHRLVPALRLLPLCMPDAFVQTADMKVPNRSKYTPQSAQADMSRWEETLTGYEDCVSSDNEQQAHRVLVSLCEMRLHATLQARRHAIEAERILETQLIPNPAASDLTAHNISLSMAKQLLDEEEQVLIAVTQAAELQTEW